VAAAAESEDKMSNTETCGCGKPKDHDAGSDFFVSIVRGRSWRPLLGPYATHDEALANVERGRTMAEKVDPQAVFDLFGTCRTNAGSGLVGILDHG
jgi:hypothetical protein